VEERIVYAVFTTPENAIGGNAICAFRLKDILKTFEGSFKEQETANSNWLPVRDMKVPNPRPGQCSKESDQLPESSLQFIKDHSIMDEAVPAQGGQPVFIRANLQHPSQFREIAVDAGVQTTDGHTFDVLFVGTDRGQVLKIVQPLGGGPAVLVEDLAVVDGPLLGLSVVGGQLLETTREQLLQLPLHRCAVALTCSACVRLQDPYCGWDILSSSCLSSKHKQPAYAAEFLQNVTYGRHRLCGDTGPSPVVIQQFTDLQGEEVDGVEDVGLDEGVRVEGRYSTEELSMAVAVATVSALIVGFIAGFLIARRCQCGGDNPYHVPYLNRSGYEEENIYAKVDDMTYYPVVSSLPHDENKHNIINNLLVTDQLQTKTLDLHQANMNKNKEFNTFNAFSTVHRSGKIYL